MSKGPWRRLHEACFYGQADDEFMKNFIKTIPCQNCKVDFLDVLQRIPKPSDPELWLDWSLALQNDIHSRNNKPLFKKEDTIKLFNLYK
jgi:hypothetical protein